MSHVIDGFWDDGYTAEAAIESVEGAVGGQVLTLRNPLKFSFRPVSPDRFESYVGAVRRIQDKDEAQAAKKLMEVQFALIQEHVTEWNRDESVSEHTLKRTLPSVVAKMILIITGREASDIDLEAEQKN